MEYVTLYVNTQQRQIFFSLLFFAIIYHCNFHEKVREWGRKLRLSFNELISENYLVKWNEKTPGTLHATVKRRTNNQIQVKVRFYWSLWIAAVCVRLKVTSYPSFLLQVSDHDDNSNILLPDHPPEVFFARSEGPLSCDVRPCSLIPLHRKAVLFRENAVFNPQCITKTIKNHLHPQSSHWCSLHISHLCPNCWRVWLCCGHLGEEEVHQFHHSVH